MCNWPPLSVLSVTVAHIVMSKSKYCLKENCTASFYCAAILLWDFSADSTALEHDQIHMLHCQISGGILRTTEVARVSKSSGFGSGFIPYTLNSFSTIRFNTFSTIQKWFRLALACSGTAGRPEHTSGLPLPQSAFTHGSVRYTRGVRNGICLLIIAGL